jgi:formylglycine-generating enzyme
MNVTRISVALAALLMAACPTRTDVQCTGDGDCGTHSDGKCLTSLAGHQWCAYPDQGCSGGYRYSTVDVGDGVSGACVALVDGGVDAPPDGSVPPLASCVSLPSTCGAAHNDSCCNSLAVPSGTYYRSYDYAGDDGSGNGSYQATVGAFRLDKYEVTVGRFRAFVQAGMGTRASPPPSGAGAHPTIAGSGWNSVWNSNLPEDKQTLINLLTCGFSTWTNAASTDDDRPMNCLTWYEAAAFCAWDGGYLPTEAEWNYAATGGDEQRAFPWSAPASSVAIDGAHASYYSAGCIGDGQPACSVTDLLPVGSGPSGDGRWGQSNLAGNVSEWTLDWYATYANPCTDCANLADTGTGRVRRGGSFQDDATIVRTAYRGRHFPEKFSPSSGVRCARSP